MAGVSEDANRAKFWRVTLAPVRRRGVHSVVGGGQATWHISCFSAPNREPWGDLLTREGAGDRLPPFGCVAAFDGVRDESQLHPLRDAP